MKRSSPIFESTRTVQRSGGSLVITLPSLFVKADEIKLGDKLKALHTIRNGILIVSETDTNDLVEKLEGIIEKLKLQEKA